MTTERMIARKRELGYTNEMISERSGVPLSTVQKIFAGITTAPRYETMRALERVLGEGISSAGIREPQAGAGHRADCLVGETQPQYDCGTPEEKKPGDYTLEDYLALPDDRRAELIDGVFYDMAAPNNVHQILSAEIWKILSDYISEHNGDCIPMLAPADVQPDCDNKTIVQPDVFVVCDRSKFTLERTVGAPDLIIEILSPSTRRKDMIVKLAKYENAGVREYWIVDPIKKYILVYDFEQESFPNIYGFHDTVTVGIFGGACRVDFAALYEKIRFLYE